MFVKADRVAARSARNSPAEPPGTSDAAEDRAPGDPPNFLTLDPQIPPRDPLNTRPLPFSTPHTHFFYGVRARGTVAALVQERKTSF